MRLQFENFGPVKKCDVTVNDLTILVGENNAGKSHIAYTLYALLEHGYDLINPEPFDELYQNIVTTGKAFVKKGHLNQLIYDSIHNYEPPLYTMFQGAFNKVEYFPSSLKVKMQLPKQLPNDIVEIGSEFGVLCGEIENGNLQLIFKGDFKKVNESTDFFQRWHEFLGYFISSKVIPSVFAITSERLGISSLNEHISSIKNKLDKRISFMGYFGIRRLMSQIQGEMNFQEGLDAFTKHTSPIYNDLIDGYLSTLLGGELRKETDKAIKLKLGKENEHIPLHLSSSSTRCLVDLYFYLKHRAEKRQVLIIDEPESHLTLKNQRVMARLIAAIVNSGVKVFITTHSDFLIKELNNLVILSNDFNGKAEWLERHSEQYSQEDKLNHNRVSVYQAKEGTLQEMPVTNRGIQVPFFDEALKDLFNTSMDLDFMMDESE